MLSWYHWVNAHLFRRCTKAKGGAAVVLGARFKRASAFFIPRLEWLEARISPATYNWTGMGDHMYWSDKANWDLMSIPTVNDSVVINSAGSVDDVLTSVSDLSLNGSTLGFVGSMSTFTVTDHLGLSGGSFGTSVTVDQRFTWAAGGSVAGSITLRGGSSATFDTAGANLSCGGLIDNSGAITWNGGSDAQGTPYALEATVMNRGGASITANGPAVLDGALTNSGTITVDGAGALNGTVSNFGTLTKMGPGTLAITWSYLDTSSSMVNVQGGTLSLQGGDEGAGTNGSFTVASGATLDTAFYAGPTTFPTFTFGPTSSITGAGTFSATIGGHALIQGTYTVANTVADGAVPGFDNLRAEIDFDPSTSYSLENVSLSADGFIGGASNITITGTLAWAGGGFEGSGGAIGKTTIPASAVVNIDTSADNTGDLSAWVFNNNGTVNWTGTQPGIGISGNFNGTFNNNAGATFNAPQAGFFFGDFLYSGDNGGTFNNAGTLTKAAGSGTFYVYSGTMNSTGTVNVKSGTLSLQGGGTSSGSFTVAAGATLDLTGGIDVVLPVKTLGPASSVSGAGTVSFGLASGETVAGITTIQGTFAPAAVIVQGGWANFETNFTVPSLTLASGILGGPANITVTNVVNWTGGTIDGTVQGINPNGTTTTIIVGSGAGMTIDSTMGSESLVNAVLSNNGTINWIDAVATLGVSIASATINNNAGANFNAPQAGGFLPNSSGTSAVFNNAGTFSKPSGNGTFTVPGTSLFTMPFNNSGAVNVQNGTVSLLGGGTSSGSFTISSGATLIVGGKHNFTSASSISGAGAVSFQDPLGNITIAGVYSITGPTTISGGQVEVDSNMTASVVNLTGGQLVVTNMTASVVNFTGGKWVIHGTVTILNTLTWTNQATFNAGGGVVSIPSGGLVSLSTTSNSVAVNGPLTFNNAGTFNWTGTNASDGIYIGGGAIINNEAGANFNGPQGGEILDPSGSVSTSFNNAGTFSLPAGTTSLTIQAVTFNNSGSVSVPGGMLGLIGGGTESGSFSVASGATLSFGGVFGGNPYSLTSASSVSGAGTVDFADNLGDTVAGTYNITGATTVTGAVTFSAPVTSLGTPLAVQGTAAFNTGAPISVATLNLKGFLNGIDNITINTLLHWSGGQMGGTGQTTVPVGATLTMDGAHKTLNRVLNNNGTATLSGNLTLNNTFTNESGASLTVSGPVTVDGSGVALNNRGTLISSSVAPNVCFFFVPVSNSGSLQVQSGALQSYASLSNSGAVVLSGSGTTLEFSGTGSYTQTAGSTSLPAGTTLSSQDFSHNNTTVMITGGVLSGAGTIDANLINGGEVMPGSTGTPGTLNVVGAYTQTGSGSLNVKLGGTGAGQFDQLAIRDKATLGGTLNTSLLGGFTPTSGSSLLVMTFTSESGTFATVNNPSGVTLTPQYGTADVTLVTGAAPFGYQVSIEGANPILAGSGFLVVVQAADASGNPITSYSGPTTLTATVNPATAGSFPATVAINSSGLGLFVADLLNVGSYTISVSDSSGTHTGTSSALTVAPAAATRLTFAAQPMNTPIGDTLPPVTVEVQDLKGNVVTSDNSDFVALGIASGPGTFAADSATTATVFNGVAIFSNLRLTTPGNYTLSAVVPGSYTGPYSAPFTVQPLQVLVPTFDATPSGFSLQFNAPFLVNSITPVLYGTGFGAAAPVPSVKLTQTRDASGNPITPVPVEGSVILNPATNSLTFLATNTASEINNGTPILPDGTYRVDLLSSGQTGWQSVLPGGGYLDGLASGTPGSADYTTTFTVAAGAAGDDVLWVPDTADGPGQLLEAPGTNQIGGGYPLYLNTAAGAPAVTQVQATLTYNPALLNVTSTSTSTFTVTVPRAGTAVLTYNGPGLSGSQLPVGVFTAIVPAVTAGEPTPYRAKDLLHLSGVTINGSSSNVTTADGLHLVAYVGDADGNGSYTSNDAVLITRTSLQSDSGFAAYPLVDPVIVADTDGSGFIPADAALQVNEAGVGFPTSSLANPPIPSGTVIVPIGNNVDPSLSIPGNLQVLADGTVNVPVNIDNADPAGSTGLLRGHLALTYDPQVFTVSAADVHLGSVLAAGSGWTMQPTISPTTGQIAIALSSTTPINSSQAGSLVTIDFHQIGTDAAAAAPIALVASVDPTGQQVVTTELEDAQGSFTLSPAPTNGFDSRIDIMAALDVAMPAMSDTAVAESVMIDGTAPIKAVGVEARPVEVAQTDTAALNRAVSDSGEGPLGAETEALHATALQSATSIASLPLTVTNGAALAWPVTMQTIPCGNAIDAHVATATGQRLSDQLFQAFLQDPTSSNNLRIGISPILNAGTTKRTLGNDPWGQARVDGPESLDWDALGCDLVWQSSGILPNAHGKRRRIEPPAVQDVTAYRSVLDQYFSQAADDPAQSAEDE